MPIMMIDGWTFENAITTLPSALLYVIMAIKANTNVVFFIVCDHFTMTLAVEHLPVRVALRQQTVFVCVTPSYASSAAHCVFKYNEKSENRYIT